MSDEQDRRRGRFRGVAKVILPTAAFIATGAMTFNATAAAFSSTTTNPGNNWAAGTVVLTSVAGALFPNETNLKPGQGGTKCLAVTYTGTLDAAVRFYIPSGFTGTLGNYLDLTVTRGTGSASNCSDFVADAGSPIIVPTQTLATYQASHTNWGTGTSSGWTPLGSSGDSRTFKIDYVLQDNNAAQSQVLNGLTFTWEAQNT